MNHQLFSESEFHQYNMEKYHESSKDSTRIAFKEDLEMTYSHGYFIISIGWMSKWRAYANSSGPMPGEVDNQSLVTKIKRQRIKCSNPESDSDIGLQDRDDYYILSVAFFKFFYDTYGCTNIIILKYLTITEEVEINQDPLAASNTFSKNKAGRVRSKARIAKGSEFSAVYESITELDKDNALR